LIQPRRGDVVLHGGSLKRRYHPIAEYMEASDTIRKSVYLLTDDKNAINEAKVEFPNTNWMFLDRPRYRAAEGGWEKQVGKNLVCNCFDALRVHIFISFFYLPDTFE